MKYLRLYVSLYLTLIGLYWFVWRQRVENEWTEAHLCHYIVIIMAYLAAAPTVLEASSHPPNERRRCSNFTATSRKGGEDCSNPSAPPFEGRVKRFVSKVELWRAIYNLVLVAVHFCAYKYCDKIFSGHFLLLLLFLSIVSSIHGNSRTFLEMVWKSERSKKCKTKLWWSGSIRAESTSFHSTKFRLLVPERFHTCSFCFLFERICWWRGFVTSDIRQLD